MSHHPVRDSDVGAAWFQVAKDLVFRHADALADTERLVSELQFLQKLGPALSKYVADKVIPDIEHAAHKAFDADALQAVIRREVAIAVTVEMRPLTDELRKLIGSLKQEANRG